MTNLKQFFSDNYIIFDKSNFIENPSLELRLIISGILKLTPEKYLSIDKEKHIISDDELSNLDEAVKQRLSGKSIAEIVTVKEFYGENIFVNQNVLIPRPETELLVESVIEFCKDGGRCSHILDMCSGSGAISIILDKYIDKKTIYAFEYSDLAIDVINQNIAIHKSKDISVIKGDIFQYSPELVFDIIVSNPPYIPSGDMVDLYKKFEVNDPKLALDGGIGGLDFYYELARISAKSIDMRGVVFMEHGIGQSSDITKIFKHINSRYKFEYYKDMSSLERVIKVHL